MSLYEYIDRQILPRYTAFDKGHQRDHAEAVMKESLRLADDHGANRDMAYTIAAYHDLGLARGRELHHVYSAEILLADTALQEWFTEEELHVMAEAVEDHRASSKCPPRTIYGAIVAEADRQIDAETILRRTLQYGLSKYPDQDFDWQFERAYDHLMAKYAEGGYMKLWLNSERNTKALAKLRTVIRDKEQLKTLCRQIYASL